jgi:hypothetical protein
MARSHSLAAWSIVLGLLAAASLLASEEPRKTKLPKEPKGASSLAKKEFAKSRAEKSHGRGTNMPINGSVAAIEEALAGPIQLDFNKAPLQDVIDYLKTTKNIEIQLDRRVLEDSGITSDTPVTINVKGVSLKSALGLMLHDMQPELSYMVTNEVLLITTPDAVEDELITRVYPVGDLTACRDEHDAPWDDYDTLIDVVVKSTGKSNTYGNTPPGSIKGGTFGTAKVLIVNQNRNVHEEIADLLTKIREIAKNNPNAGTPRRSRPSPPLHGKIPKEKPRVIGMMCGGMGGGTF